MELLVANLPRNALAFTNKIYLSPQDRPRFPAGALLGVQGIPFVCDAHPDINPGCIGLNGLHRRYLQVPLDAAVTVKVRPVAPEETLSALTWSVDLLGAKAKTGRNAVGVDTAALAAAVSAAFDGHFFLVGQVAALECNGVRLELKVTEVDTLRLRTTEQVATGGQLSGATQVTFSRASGAGVSLEGDAIAGGAAATIFRKDFDFEKLGIGGLNEEFNEIFRRAFASRLWPTHIIRQMGISHVRGMLLFGPPGCGKTLIARQIGKVLNAREPKIVNGPEILNKYVGGSEEKIRELFADAEKEQGEVGDASMLHIIILDEMDAICKSRGTVKDGTGVSDSVVNQLLSKIDGVDSLNNILLIGMTNRKDMIDDALLRPGRLEVHVEIGLPDAKGRLQVLHIHTKSMREHQRIREEAVARLPEFATRAKNFSGAEIEGLVKSASSYAFARCVDVKDLSKGPDVANLLLRSEDFERALDEVEPKFGAKSTELRALYRNGIFSYGRRFDLLMGNLSRLVEQVRTSDKTPLMTVLLEGSPFSGKTAVAAKVAVDSSFPFVRMISADEMIGYSDSSKCQHIHKIFLDSYKSPLSLILLDDIERLIEYVPIGPRFSNAILQTLLVLLKKIPPDHGRRLLVVGTTSSPALLEELGLVQAFGIGQHVALLEGKEEVREALLQCADVGPAAAAKMADYVKQPIGIKQLLMVTEMSRQGEEGGTAGGAGGAVDINTFVECLHTVGY